MRGKFLILTLAVGFLLLAISPVLADPVVPNKGPGFVCPVLGGKAGENPNSPWQNPDHPLYGIKFAMPPGGFYTVLGPELNVPEHATNQNGAGSPGGPFASPGETDYSPIWWTP
jgi:hypothetical protein